MTPDPIDQTEYLTCPVCNARFMMAARWIALTKVVFRVVHLDDGSHSVAAYQADES